MADDTNFRSYRPADQRWPAQPSAPGKGKDAGNDPLAELARLIGQTDPFAELNKTAPPRAAVPGRPTPVMPPQPRAPAAPAHNADPHGSPLQVSGKGFGRPSQHPAAESFQPAYDPAIYGAPEQPEASGYPSEGYYDDPPRVRQGDEVYAEEYAEERPRRGMKLALAAVALVVLGTSGVFGYRALFSGPSGPPPVIKANTAPNKIAPGPSEAANKQIYDRVGDKSQGERVVSREERPVEVKDNSRPGQARAAFPGAPSTISAQEAIMINGSAPLPTDPGGPASAEPKKIRTVAIRPDGTGNHTAPRPANGAAPAQRAAGMPLDTAPTATPSARAAAAAPAASAPPQGNAPLSLSPQVASAETSARSTFPPPPPRPAAAAAAPAAPTRLAAVPPPTEAAAGAYVQVAAQRGDGDAQASFRNLQAKFPSILGDRQAVIRRADLGADKGVYYRAMVGPFASMDQAKQFCGSLKSAGGNCVVHGN